MGERELPAASDWAKFWNLDPSIVFMNHGSFGACPAELLASQQRLRDQMESEPVRFFVRELPILMDEARMALAEFVGAETDSLALLPNATTGINAVLRSHPFEAGDEILIIDHVYNAVRNAADYVANRAGAHVRTVPIPFPIEDPETVVETVVGAVTPRTSLAILDHITSPTGLVMPMARLVSELRERGVETLVDGAHVPGQLDLCLNELGAAYYVGNCHKWMCTPKGAALLYVRPDRKQFVRPTAISHGANMLTTRSSRYRLEFDWRGTVDPTPYLVIPDAIRFFAEKVPGGWSEMRRMNRALALQTRSIVASALGVDVPCPDSMVGFLAAVPLPDGVAKQPDSPLYTDPLQDKLLASYGIEVPIVPWPSPPKRLVRTSSQLYNSRSQAEYLAAVLTEVLDD